MAAGGTAIWLLDVDDPANLLVESSHLRLAICHAMSDDPRDTR